MIFQHIDYKLTEQRNDNFWTNIPPTPTITSSVMSPAIILTPASNKLYHRVFQYSIR